MEYSLDKYKYFSYKDSNGKNTIAAMSTYAGRNVKGYAKCDPRDAMDIQKGKELAAARCNEKVAEKRVKRASQKYMEAARQADAAQRHFARMKQYYMDAVDQRDAAAENVNSILTKM